MEVHQGGEKAVTLKPWFQYKFAIVTSHFPFSNLGFVTWKMAGTNLCGGYELRLAVKSLRHDHRVFQLPGGPTFLLLLATPAVRMKGQRNWFCFH